MRGQRTGLRTRVQNENSKALYIHCYAHTLQLAVQDASKLVKVISDALNLAAEVGKLVKNSPKREAAFRKLKIANLDAPAVGLRILCPTRYVC